MRAVHAVVFAVLATALVLAGCGDNRPPQSIAIVVPPGNAELLAAATDMAAFTGYARMDVVAAEPAAAPAADFVITVALDGDTAQPESYAVRAPAAATTQEVHAGGHLGAQYGITHALENLGFRFRSPYATYWPSRLRAPAAALPDVVHAPEIRVRGFQLHTLHPFEAYFAFWEPGAENLADARRIIDWTIKSRGNFVQWVGLNDIVDPAVHAAWKPHTQAILQYARARGVRTGLNLQLYGQSNLQRAFDLWHEPDAATLEESLAERLPLITGDIAFDVYDLSFGEFFNANPDGFVADVNTVAAAFFAAAPAAELHAFIHVGDEQRVDYMGEQDILYYFLVKFADPRIIPDVHTVMFYDLYEDAGGAYHHENFDEHRAYLLERIAAGEPAAYVPETSYWVSFDVSVPIYLPLYVRNRQLDLARLAADPLANGNPLDAHVLFTTGWEWGYWLHDYTALRASYENAEPAALIADAFGDDLAPAVPTVLALIDLQKTALMDQRLIAYMAGRDQSFELGRNLGIVSQPDRVTFDDLLSADAATRAAVATDTDELLAFADALDQIAADVSALNLPRSRWTRELRDATAVTALRARFIAATYLAMLAHLSSDPAFESHHTAALALLEEATAIVDARGDDLHFFRPTLLTDRRPNSTFYPYGYLHMADTLCFWRRELRQVEVHAGLSTQIPPDCIL